jgi:rhamnosyltransferase subunit B
MPASAQKKILIATFGSLGDLNPFIALGHALQRQGFAPVLATSENYRDFVEAEGLDFVCVRPDADQITHRLGMDLGEIAKHMANDGGFLFQQVIFPYLRESFDDLLAASQGASAIIAHALAFSGRAVAEARGLPLINVLLSPLMLYSPHDPPLGALGPHAPFAPPSSAAAIAYNRAALWTLLQLAGMWAAPLRRFRREVGLPPARGLDLLLGSRRGNATIGLFSPLLARTQAPLEPGVVITGHSFHDRLGEVTPPLDLQNFLASGSAPIVFTLGSFVAQGRAEHYRACMEAARRLQRRALLLTHDKDHEELRENLPADVFVAAYVPHSQVFPYACVTVHHGGIGTSGQALRAGRPQLVTPYLGDQHDNAERLCRMGLARRLESRKLCARTLARELDMLLQDPAYGRRAREVALIVSKEDGAGVAARFIAKSLSSSR